MYAKLKDALVDQRSNGDVVFDSEEIPSIRPGKLAPSILSFEFVVSISEILSISEYGVLRFPANFKPVENLALINLGEGIPPDFLILLIPVSYTHLTLPTILLV